MRRELEECYTFRNDLVDALTRDLMGPGEPDETISDPPITRYLTGILYPQSNDQIDPSEDVDQEEGDDEDSESDPPVAMVNTHYPSSIGVTFAVDLEAEKHLTVRTSAARYVPEGEATDEDPDRWRRVRLGPDEVRIDASTPHPDARFDLGDGLELFARVRASADSVASVTLALVNTRQAEGFMKDADSFFQVGITARGASGSACFVERPAPLGTPHDEDLRSFRLLYRHARSYAVGHGCAATWPAEQADHRAAEITTTFVPSHDLLLAASNPEITAQALNLRHLAHEGRDEISTGLEQLCVGYESWIAAQRTATANISDPERQQTATDHMKGCDTALARMRAGIDVLAKDDLAWEAFRLANRALLEQRARSVWVADGKPEGGPDYAAGHAWHPFQLAYILQCLQGVVDPDHEDRLVADLLWFPTGGGKTEAYLGLIAFTIFHRRLKRGPAGDGVTVLMRYTLRLLTIQQFERAALLICCCEALRRKEARLGTRPISIGLWVGRGGTPNTLQDAGVALDKLRSGAYVEEGNPVQVHRCPWCGTKLTPTNYWRAKSPPRLVIQCKNEKCTFNEGGLPVFVVDEDIYRFRPSLIVATADKFAILPWKSEVSPLFNIGSNSPPPELIVQDELHLISGPLGTLAGLYETAVDLLSTEDGRPPKVIASTATIRRAGAQTKGLFTRAMHQFPPPGLDARNSYFAVETPATEKGSRRYVGLMAPGSSQTTLMVRTYAALLENAAKLDGTDAARDPYWTLVGYFNSLRILGGARMQVQDDVQDRMRLLSGGEQPRAVDERIELTSREPSSSIPAHLDRMSVSYPHEDALDVILATNMISVGVDIDRLGLMAVMGQPQSTSEYIQSTSRVGRQHPGLILTMFNSSRSRDRSHYESFVGYHSAIYRQVESTSVTPFSSRARDRGLHAVLIALARMTLKGFADNKSARDVAKFRDELEVLAERIVERVARIDKNEVDATRSQLHEIIEAWVALADRNPELVFSSPYHPDKALLIDAIKADDAPLGSLPTPYSLRDVDAESGLYLVSG